MSASALFRVFVAAAKETPRLYFAPIVEALRAVHGVQETMVNGRKRVVRAQTVDHASPKPQRPKQKKRRAG